nr:deoxycytidine triphosphate deaminase [uncultured bacterium]
MSVITRDKILERIKNNEISFKPELDSFQLQGHSVDLRLGFTFMIPKSWHMTPRGREVLDSMNFDKHSKEYFDVIELEAGQYFDLLPHEFILVSTFESIKVPNDLMAVLYPRSSTNRKGLSLDLTGIIDSGYEGQLILPMRNNTNSQPVRLYPGERLCQIVFEELSDKIEPRKSKYHQKDVIDGVQKEQKTEVDFIMKGDMKGLKESHKIS